MVPDDQQLGRCPAQYPTRVEGRAAGDDPHHRQVRREAPKRVDGLGQRSGSGRIVDDRCEGPIQIGQQAGRRRCKNGPRQPQGDIGLIAALRC
jgi:hypothetical protein